MPLHELRRSTRRLLKAAGLLREACARCVPLPRTAAAAERRAADHTGGRLAARRALRALLGRAPRLHADDRGAVRWPRGLQGSITHGGGVAMVVVARGSACRAVGIDLEPRRPSFPPGAAVFDEKSLQQQRLRARPAAEAAGWRFLLFSATESFLKAAHAACGRVPPQAAFDALRNRLAARCSPPAHRPVNGPGRTTLWAARRAGFVLTLCLWPLPRARRRRNAFPPS
ncbi:hypothetical protein [Rubrivivax rivuli]|uniref:hypothetical protein n=1 Tax=Rubrivivax rivuli TaxID=1862385 RepID=UPI0013E334CD|nr:hypothetical protein [Rubrivivax rivuli]